MLCNISKADYTPEDINDDRMCFDTIFLIKRLNYATCIAYFSIKLIAKNIFHHRNKQSIF